MAIANGRNNDGIFAENTFNINDSRPFSVRQVPLGTAKVVYENSLGQLLAEVDAPRNEDPGIAVEVLSDYDASFRIIDSSLDGSTGSFTARALDVSGSVLEAALATYRVGTFAIDGPAPGSKITA